MHMAGSCDFESLESRIKIQTNKDLQSDDRIVSLGVNYGMRVTCLSRRENAAQILMYGKRILLCTIGDYSHVDIPVMRG